MLHVDYARWGQTPEDLRRLATGADHRRTRERFLALDPHEFIATLERWMLVYCPHDGATVPGITDDELARLAVPTLVFRSGASDPHHVHCGSPKRLARTGGSVCARLRIFENFSYLSW